MMSSQRTGSSQRGSSQRNSRPVQRIDRDNRLIYQPSRPLMGRSPCRERDLKLGAPTLAIKLISRHRCRRDRELKDVRLSAEQDPLLIVNLSLMWSLPPSEIWEWDGHARATSAHDVVNTSLSALPLPSLSQINASARHPDTATLAEALIVMIMACEHERHSKRLEDGYEPSRPSALITPVIPA